MDAAAPPQTAKSVTEADCLNVLAELRPLLASPTAQASSRFRDALNELLEVDQPLLHLLSVCSLSRSTSIWQISQQQA
jgi:hypothetical protein